MKPCPSQPFVPSSAGKGVVSTHIKSCPFCGNADFSEGLVDENEGVAYTPWYRIICRECGTFTEGARDSEEAIAAWNQRYPTAPSPAYYASAALYGFMGWLTSQPVAVGPFSSHHSATQAANLVEQFCKAQGYEGPPDGWADALKPYPSHVAPA